MSNTIPPELSVAPRLTHIETRQRINQKPGVVEIAGIPFALFGVDRLALRFTGEGSVADGGPQAHDCVERFLL